MKWEDTMKKKKIFLVTMAILCMMLSVVIYATPRDSKGWNVYNASGTVYANVGVTYVSDTFANKGVVSYNARVLGQDKDSIVEGNAASIKIIGEDGICHRQTKFWGSQPRSGTFKINRNSNSYVNVYVEIEGKNKTVQIKLN